MSSLSTHILDTARGVPAQGVRVTLAALDRDPDATPHLFTTDENGRIGALPTGGAPGRYRLSYEVGAYLGTEEGRGLYPRIELEVVLDPGRHHHVVLTLSPQGYFVACVPS